MSEFAAILEKWQAFYATIGTSSATLTGLLFVALSIERARSTDRTRPIARGALADFLYVLMLALIFLVPDQTPQGFAVALVVLSLARGGALVRFVVRPGQTRRPRWSAGQRIREVALPLTAVVGLLLIAGAVLGGRYEALYGLVGVLAALLAKATWTAWLFLVGEGA